MPIIQLVLYTKAMIVVLGVDLDSVQDGEMLGPERTAVLAQKVVKELQAEGIKDPTPKQIVERMRK